MKKDIKIKKIDMLDQEVVTKHVVVNPKVSSRKFHVDNNTKLVPSAEYVIMSGNNPICYIPSFYINHREIANAIAEVLNKNSTIKIDIEL